MSYHSRKPDDRRERSPRDASPHSRNRSDYSRGRRNEGDGNRRRKEEDGNRNRKDSSYQWGKPEEEEEEDKRKPKAKKEEPNFAPSGLLAKETNTVKGVTLKFAEPDDAMMPKIRYRLYVFKGDDLVDTVHIHRKSCFLLGRSKEVADIIAEHPSCSSQHAVIQYRSTEKMNDDGSSTRQVKPFLMDLESTNGTFLRMNGDMQKLEAARYYELRAKDVFKLGNSTREYVLMREDTTA